MSEISKEVATRKEKEINTERGPITWFEITPGNIRGKVNRGTKSRLEFLPENAEAIPEEHLKALKPAILHEPASDGAIVKRFGEITYTITLTLTHKL